MAWFGGTNGRPTRRIRTSECAVQLDSDAAGRVLDSSLVGREIVVLAGWRGDELQFAAGDERLRERIGDFDVAHLIWMTGRPLHVRPDRLRWTFECPLCGRTCRQLYARWDRDRILCRVCHRLSYESAQVWDNEARRGRPGGLLGRMCDEIARGGDGSAALTRAADRDARRYADL